MAKLVLSINEEVVKEYELDREILTIGRNPANDIHFDDRATSGNHAKVFTILNDSFIEDLDSTNGTFIGDNKITRHALENGENIFIGKHELKYVKADAECDKSEFEQTMIVRQQAEFTAETKEANKNPEESIGKMTADLAYSDTTASGPGPAKLQLISGNNAGKELQLSKILTTLGKPGVQAAAITRRATGYFLIVVDAGEDNKVPLVNGTVIDKQRLLADGDEIEVAGVQMRFNLL